MIDLIFYYGTEIIFARIKGNTVRFSTSAQHNKFATIDGIKLSREGVIKEHPDLKNRKDWQQEARKRFKEHISKMKNENEVANYIIKELRSKGYVPKYKQIAGFRTQKLK